MFVIRREATGAPSEMVQVFSYVGSSCPISPTPEESLCGVLHGAAESEATAYNHFISNWRTSSNPSYFSFELAACNAQEAEDGSGTWASNHIYRVSGVALLHVRPNFSNKDCPFGS